MTEPHVGTEAPGWQVATCAYSPTPRDLVCLADATWHGVTDSHEGLPCCDAHKPIMATLARWVHPHGSACGLPGARFYEDINRCVLPWEADVSELVGVGVVSP